MERTKVFDHTPAERNAPQCMVIFRDGHNAEIKPVSVPKYERQRNAVEPKAQEQRTNYFEQERYLPQEEHRCIAEKDLSKRDFDYENAMGTRILKDQSKLDNRYYVNSNGIKTQDTLGRFTWKDRQFTHREVEQTIPVQKPDERQAGHQDDSQMVTTTRPCGQRDNVYTMLGASYKDDGLWE